MIMYKALLWMFFISLFLTSYCSDAKGQKNINFALVDTFIDASAQNHQLSSSEDMHLMKESVLTINFVDNNELDNWIIVNDTVMGGRSSASIALEKNSLAFSGDLSLENNGGFASIRRVYEPLAWQDKAVFVITVKGDGRTYQFRLRTNRFADGVAYVANFDTKKGEEQTYRFLAQDFTPQFRGRVVSNAPALAFSEVQQLGFMLADKSPGDFLLLIKRIEQYPQND
uniref:CIA30 family protein n=1 Tax=Ningiella ruwaisensis TaxID=2364274 RepID=UPI001F4FFC3C|nr:CIA30 family protein [Ningiella ruwaisensis]